MASSSPLAPKVLAQAACSSSEHRRAGSVPEEDAGAPIRKVGDSAEHLRTDQQCIAPRALQQQPPDHLEPIEKPGAPRIQVKTGDVFREPQPPLEQAGLTGGQIIRCDRAYHTSSQLFRTDTCPLHRLLGRTGRKVRCRLLSAKSPGPDACP